MTEDYDYYQCPAEIASDIDNWRRWLISGNGGKRCCRSLEGRYISTDVWEGKRPTIQINILEAIEVEKIVVLLPNKNKQAMKFYHIYRLPTPIMRRKLGERDIGCLMRNSWDMIKNGLDKHRNYATMMKIADTV